jgi:hypothetical protein
MDCYNSGRLREWLDKNLARDPDNARREIVAEFSIVGNEKDGPLEDCIPRYRETYPGGMLTREVMDEIIARYRAARPKMWT